MTTNKLAIIGGSGLYDVEEFKARELLDFDTPWGKPSDQILKTNYNNKEVYFLDFSTILLIVSSNAFSSFINVVISLNKIPFFG